MNQRSPQIEVTRSTSALIVDDEPFVCEYLASVLKDWEIDVHCAHDVATALAFAAGDAPLDVAFVDLDLPDATGLELISELHRLRPNVRIVIASAYAGMAAADAIDSATTEWILGKPYDHTSIARVVLRMDLPERWLRPPP